MTNRTTPIESGIRILANGVTVSNDTRLSGLNNNDMIIGSSGSGKTGGYVIPNIQNITGSLVVSDTKGQLSRRFTKELKTKGYQVYTLDLVDPMKSCGYDPLSGIRRYCSLPRKTQNFDTQNTKNRKSENELAVFKLSF